MRCLTLASQLRESGVEAIFICREHPGNLIEWIKESGFRVCSLPLSKKTLLSDSNSASYEVDVCENWLGNAWESDAEETLHVLGGARADCLIVDHYAIDKRWEATLRHRVEKIVVIDDLANRVHECDVLLDQNLGSQESDYLLKVPVGTILLIGPRYALLRPDFSRLRTESLARRISSSCQKIAISMGGVDISNQTSKILNALSYHEFLKPIEVDVILGHTAVHIEAIMTLLLDLPYKVNLHIGTPKIAEILAESDLLIGAGGTTVWEACSLGLPSLLIVAAKNQIKSVTQLNKLGCALMLDGSMPISIDLPKKMKYIMTSDHLKKMSKACAVVTDGLGAKLVARKLLELSVKS